MNYRVLWFTFCGVAGALIVAPLHNECLSLVTDTFQSADLRVTIHASQMQGQKFRDFCVRAMQAGVQSYEVFLKG